MCSIRVRVRLTGMIFSNFCMVQIYDLFSKLLFRMSVRIRVYANFTENGNHINILFFFFRI